MLLMSSINIGFVSHNKYYYKKELSFENWVSNQHLSSSSSLPTLLNMPFFSKISVKKKSCSDSKPFESKISSYKFSSFGRE